MTATQLIWEVLDRGHSIRLEGDTIVVRPKLDARLRELVLAQKPEIIAYLRKHGSATPPHPFTALRSADAASVQARGVCIACGVPWAAHGVPARSAWRYVDDPNEVALFVAYG